MRVALISSLLLVCGLLHASCGGESPDPAPTPSVTSNETEDAGPRQRYDVDGRHRDGTRDAASRRPNLIVLVIDTLRADCVGRGSDAPADMPFVSKLAERGVALRSVAAPAPWTAPSMTSMLTGLLPSQHGCNRPGEMPRLHPSITTYAEVLKNSYGYVTGAYTSGPWMSAQSRILQGFDFVGSDFHLQASETQLARFAKERDRERPFFLMLHTLEAHDPYGADGHPWPRPDAAQLAAGQMAPGGAVPAPWEMTRDALTSYAARNELWRRFGEQVGRTVVRYTYSGFAAEPRPELARQLEEEYRGGVRWVDGLIAKTMSQLEAWEMLENTVFVITADHGEAFGEHGTLGHGRQLYDELIHVPMVMVGPTPFDGGRELPQSAGLIDLLPTFLEFAGGEPLDGVQGRSFLPLLRRAGPGRPVFGEEILNRDHTGEDRKAILTSVRSERWKYIVTYDELAGTVREEVYDLLQDPAESTDLAGPRGLGDLPFDAAFCAAVEQARDRIWGATEEAGRVSGSPYAAGRALVTSRRPAPCRVVSR